MSIINAWVTESQALVCVDSEAVAADGSTRPMSKLLPITHLGAVMAMRGHADGLNFLFLKYQIAGLRSFDELLAATPALLEETARLVASYRANIELFLCGWSAARNRMAAMTFVRPEAGEPFTSSEVFYCVAPWHESIGEVPDPSTPDAMCDIAQRQVQWARAAFPERPIGGDLTICMFDKHMMAFTRVAKHEYMLEHVERGEALAA